MCAFSIRQARLRPLRIFLFWALACWLMGQALVAGAAVAPPGTLIPNIASVSVQPQQGPPRSIQSNEVLIQVLADDYVGVAKMASQPYVNTNSSGAPDGTATVRFSLRVKSYSLNPLYQFVLTDGAAAGGQWHGAVLRAGAALRAM